MDTSKASSKESGAATAFGGAGELAGRENASSKDGDTAAAAAAGVALSVDCDFA